MTALTTSYALIAIPNSTRAASFRPIVSELARTETILVRDGDAAMKEIAERGAPGLLIVDLSLPRIDGFALMRSLRGQGGATTRIVAMSAYETLRAAARDLSLPLGIGAVLPLDVTPGALRDGLTSLLSRVEERASAVQTPIFGTGSSDARPMEADEVLDRAALEIRRRFKMPFSIGYLRVGDHESVATHMSTTDPNGGLAFGDLSDLEFLRQVADAADPLVVPNVDNHPVYARLALKGARPFRGFAVVPVATSRPNTKAALCVLDTKPIALTASDIDALAGLARAVGHELDRSITPVIEAPSLPTELNGTLTDDVEALQHLASTDPLTGLANRRGGEKHIANEISRARREKRPLSCLLIDIDRFKQVNDTFGHQAGDQLLRDISGLLRRTVRAYDILIRWGGEEFLVVLPGVELVAARVLAERVRTAVETLDTHGIGPVTISAGAATFEKDYDFASTLKTADRRLYQAKAAGRNSVA
jgi:diguanylate cyclase (GGDEF)-like protein